MFIKYALCGNWHKLWIQDYYRQSRCYRLYSFIVRETLKQKPISTNNPLKWETTWSKFDFNGLATGTHSIHLHVFLLFSSWKWIRLWEIYFFYLPIVFIVYAIRNMAGSINWTKSVLLPLFSIVFSFAEILFALKQDCPIADLCMTTLVLLRTSSIGISILYLFHVNK